MVRLSALFLLAAALAYGQQPSLIIPHVADGGGWKTTIAIFNGFNGIPTRLSIVFRGPDGDKIAFPVTNFGIRSSIDLDLEPTRSLFLETAGAGANVQTGWVEVQQFSGHEPVRGFAIFKQSIPGRPDFEAVSMGMRTAAFMTFPFDNTNGMVTSFAIVNLASSACTMGVAPIFDETGAQVASEAKLIGNMLPNGQVAFVSTDRIPEMANRRGYLTFRPQNTCAPGGLVMLGLRFNPSGPFTNLLPLLAPSP
ncbi:MAG: hypothetical protein HY238_14135 [Acidobacteria bacterium]|nr:hypothetical protein [Acidobacteriota bacterium]